MPLSHRWDDWDPYPLIAPNNPKTEADLGGISDWAKLVFAIGCAEWVVVRLAPDASGDRAWQYIDACWAHALSEDYALPEELDDEEWEGPMLGPVCLALVTIVNTKYGFDEDNAELDAGFAEQVARHVLPDPAPFFRWRDAVLQRLLSVAPADAAPAPGMRLPRQVLDPDEPIDSAMLNVLRKRALDEIDLADNPFVARLERDA